MGTFNFNHRLHVLFKILLKNFHVISFVLLIYICTSFPVPNSKGLLHKKGECSV